MNNIAMIAYTTLSTDARVVREARAAKDAGFHVDMFVLNDTNNVIFNDLTIYTTRVFQYKGSNKLRFILSYLTFFLITFYKLTINYYKKKYKIIHVNNIPNFLVYICIIPKIFGANIILDVHDLVPELFADKFNISIDHWIIKILYIEEIVSCWFADLIISTNRLHIKRLRARGIKKDEFPEILNSADERIFTPFTGHEFDSEIVRVIFPTTVAKRLGIDTLLSAFEIISKINLLIHLEIYGDGEYSEILDKKIKQLGLGEQIYFSKQFISFEELSRRLEGAHIGVIPWPSNYSTNYQMPMKIHEYFIKGLCVVAADVDVIKEYFNDCVQLFKAGDSMDLARKILYLVEDRLRMRYLAESGHYFYLKNPWRKYKQRYQNLLLKLCKDNR